MPRPRRAALTVCVTSALLFSACTSADDDPPTGGAGAAGSAGSMSGFAGSTATAGTGAAGRDHTITGTAGAGGTGSGGNAGSSGSAGAGGSIGQAGAHADAGAAGSDDGTSSEPGFCPGVTLPANLTGQQLCTDDAQCTVTAPFFACMLTQPSYCGGVPPSPECGNDESCGAGRVCRLIGCGDAICEPGCEMTGCAGSERCESGRCVAKLCDDPDGAPCAEGFVCDSASTDAGARGCRALSCHGEGYECPVGWDCGADGTDVHGCLHRHCQTAADCECGSCIAGFCEPHPGACFTTSQPP